MNATLQGQKWQNGLSRARRWAAAAVLAGTALLATAGLAAAWIREGAVPGRTGLRFHSLDYGFDHLQVSVTNRNGQNVIFGGTMVFLDRNGRVTARAELLPAKIKRHSTHRYRAAFVEGTGPKAAGSARLVWDLSQRNN